MTGSRISSLPRTLHDQNKSQDLALQSHHLYLPAQRSSKAHRSIRGPAATSSSNAFPRSLLIDKFYGCSIRTEPLDARTQLHAFLDREVPALFCHRFQQRPDCDEHPARCEVIRDIVVICFSSGRQPCLDDSTLHKSANRDNTSIIAFRLGKNNSELPLD